MDEHLAEIINDINDEKCVLIIGPDMGDFGDKSFFEAMCDDFSNDTHYNSIFDNAPQYVFLNEELIQLKPGANEITVLKMMQRFYQKQKVFDEPLKKISQIPFHLILSLMPDDRLRCFFTGQKLDFNYGYYPVEEVFKQVSEKPSKQRPLLYNLFGDFNETDAVITFDNMFSYLSNIMGKQGLPLVIDESLKKATTFVFLGVHFERWHVQLILMLITKKKRFNYSILKNGNANDVCLFVGRRLKLEFLGNDPIDFLNVIFDTCQEYGMLKPIAKVFISYSHKDTEIVNKMIVLLKAGNIEIVVDENDMSGGQNIDDFVTTIAKVDFVIPVISCNSLFSPWVIKEINTTVENRIKLLPVSLDQALFSDNLNAEALKYAKEAVKEINGKISENEFGSIDNLVSERNMWAEYNTYFPKAIDEVKKKKCRVIDEKRLEESVDLIIKDILSLK